MKNENNSNSNCSCNKNKENSNVGKKPNEGHKAKFAGVEDTIYIPLAGRIAVSKKFPEYFYDSKALELEEKIPQAAMQMKFKEYENLAAVARYFNLDRIVRQFIERTGSGNIINLGAGLETMYYRITAASTSTSTSTSTTKTEEAEENEERKATETASGTIRHTFYELDFPDVIKLRKAQLGEGENEILIEGDINNLEWTKEITNPSLPTLMIASGVFQYFHRHELLEFFKRIKEKFPKGEIVFDATDKFGIKMANYFVRRTGNQSAPMHFYIKSAQEIANATNTELYSHITFFMETRKILRKKLKTSTKILMMLGDRFKKANIIHLKF